jgi:hypothetical protein
MNFHVAQLAPDSAVIEWLDEVPGAVELNSLRTENPWTRAVVVTRMDGDNAVVAPSVADSIVWFRHAHAELEKAVRTPPNGLRSRMAGFIRDGLTCSKRTKLALLAAANADPPIRTVAEWAGHRAVAKVQRTLQYWFAREFASGLTAKFFLDSMVLFWARDAFPGATSWVALGNHAEANPEMLKETAVRLIGASPPGADPAQLVRELKRGSRLSPETVGLNIIAHGLAALLRSRS